MSEQTSGEDADDMSVERRESSLFVSGMREGSTGGKLVWSSSTEDDEDRILCQRFPMEKIEQRPLELSAKS